jgi:hypothetical protein
MLFRQAAIAGGVAQARSSPRRRRHRFSAAMEQKGSLKGPKTIAEPAIYRGGMSPMGH